MGLLAGLAMPALAAAHGIAPYRPEAKADAAQQLSQVSLPAGARRVSSDPSASSSLGELPWYPQGGYYALEPPYTVDDHGFWAVSEDPSSVVDWIKAHPPPASRISWSKGSRGSSHFTIVFRFSSDHGRVVERALVSEVTRARSGGTAVRADGVAEWLPVRPSWDYVPKRARVLTATLTWQGWGGKKRSESVTFTSERKVAAIARSVNHARAIPPHPPPPCAPINIGETLRLSFQARHDGPALARAASSFFCGGTLVVTVNGRHGPGLWPPQRLWTLVSQLKRRHRAHHA